MQLQAELEQQLDDSVLNSRLVAYASDQVTLGAIKINDSFLSVSEWVSSDNVETCGSPSAGALLSWEGGSDHSGQDEVSAHWWAVFSERRHFETSHPGGQRVGAGALHGRRETTYWSMWLWYGIYTATLWGTILNGTKSLLRMKQ